MPKNKYKVILFDLDNTIGDSTSFVYNAHWDHVNQITKGKKFDEITKEAMVQDLTAWDLLGCYTNNKAYDLISKKYNIKFDERFLTQKNWQHYALKYFRLWPDTIETFKGLQAKGYRLGLLSNGHHPMQYMKVKNTGAFEYFEHCIISGEVKTRKPKTEIFKIAIKKFGVKAEECVYVGDNFSIDILGANRAGLKPVWLNKENTIHKSDVTEIKKLSELLKIF